MRNQALIAVIALVVIVAGVIGYQLLRPSAPASAPIQAIPIDANATLETTTAEEPTAVAANQTEATVAPTDVAEPTVAATEETPDEATAEPEATTAAEPEATEAPVPTEPVAAAPTTFEIDQTASQASFTIDEVLRGTPTTVVGTTDQVAGQIAVNPADLSQTQVGTIQINARTLATDADRRNGAIRNFVLNTDQYEFITFTPTAITGLPASATVGEPYTFQMTGDLTIKDVTQPVTFDVAVTGLSEGQLQGSATSTITYAEWGIGIPDVPFVADVGSTLVLKLDFIANAIS